MVGQDSQVFCALSLECSGDNLPACDCHRCWTEKGRGHIRKINYAVLEAGKTTRLQTRPNFDLKDLLNPPVL
ncbi:hypothetical protein GJAV_G00232010 [Gymnothorax javanicus]|nr:hypothetical protein GJAV_G00232010 [Gymnothorax javanicus]